MKIKIKMDKSAIDNIHKKEVDALVDTAKRFNEKLKDDEVIPYATGATERSTVVNDSLKDRNRVYITSGNEEAWYANKIYHQTEREFRKIHNKNASPEWLEKELEDFGGKDFLSDEFAENMKRRFK